MRPIWSACAVTTTCGAPLPATVPQTLPSGSPCGRRQRGEAAPDEVLDGGFEPGGGRGGAQVAQQVEVGRHVNPPGSFVGVEGRRGCAGRPQASYPLRRAGGSIQCRTTRARPGRPGAAGRLLYRRAIETSAGQDRRPQRRRSAERQRQLRRRRGVALLVLVVVLVLIVWRAASCGGCGCGGGAEEQVAQAGPVPPPPAPALDRRRRQGRARSSATTGAGSTGRDRRPSASTCSGRSSSAAAGAPASTTPTRRASGPAAAGPGSPASSWTAAGPTSSPAPTSTSCARSTPRPARSSGPTSTTTSSRAARRCSRTPRRRAPTTSTSSSPGRGAGTRYKLDDPRVAPVRAVTFGSGKELWRLPVPQTRCYSRDCDGSGFYYDGAYYIGVESGYFYALDPLEDPAVGRGRRSRSIAAQQLLLGDERADEPRAQPRAGVVRLGARQEPVRRVRRRPRVRPPALRPHGRLGLLHRLRPRRHAGADQRRACCCRPWRRSTSRARAACCAWTRRRPAGRGDGVVLPDGEPQGRRLGRRRRRLGAPSTTSTTPAASTRRCARSAPSTATSTWSHRT